MIQTKWKVGKQIFEHIRKELLWVLWGEGRKKPYKHDSSHFSQNVCYFEHVTKRFCLLQDHYCNTICFL